MPAPNANLIVCGSSGYVGSFLMPLLKRLQPKSLIGIDLKPGPFTTHVANISDESLWEELDQSVNYTIINLAAARFDYDITASTYYSANVDDTQGFLDNLNNFAIDQLIHISSVAAFDGTRINYHDHLACDDAYRVTKSLQGEKIKKYCSDHAICLTVLYPSAIFDDVPRGDTNIGKLQYISNFFPFLPRIDVHKSLTYLPKFADFIVFTESQRLKGEYMTIETPISTVSEIMLDTSKIHRTRLIRIPFLKFILLAFSYVLLFLGKVFGRDPKLVPSRVRKLFTDTAYIEQHYRFKLDIYRLFDKDDDLRP